MSGKATETEMEVDVLFGVQNNPLEDLLFSLKILCTKLLITLDWSLEWSSQTLDILQQISIVKDR